MGPVADGDAAPREGLSSACTTTGTREDDDDDDDDDDDAGARARP